MRWIDVILILLLGLAICAVHRACGAERPPQAPCPPQAPPCVDHHEPPAPSTDQRWRRDGWQRDSTGAWFRWVDRAQPSTYLAPVFYSPPATYQQPVSRVISRRGGC